MDAQRQAAAGAHAPAAPAAIPPYFHFIWFGGEVPEEYWGYMRRWLYLHPGWKAYLWEERDMVGMQNQVLYDYAQEISPGNEHQLRSDIARLEALWKFGGVYVDCDMEPKRSIAPLLEGCEAFLGWEVPDVWANNAIMGAAPGHPFIRRCIDGLAQHVQQTKGPGVRPNVLSGPQYVTKQLGDDVVVYPKDYFYPYLWNELYRKSEDFPTAYAVHHWNNKRSKVAA